MYLCWFIFFVCPKKTNQKKRHFFRGVFVPISRDKIAIKSESIIKKLTFHGLFMATLMKKSTRYPL